MSLSGCQENASTAWVQQRQGRWDGVDVRSESARLLCKP
jgi:hypothetical protein